MLNVMLFSNIAIAHRYVSWCVHKQ